MARKRGDRSIIHKDKGIFLNPEKSGKRRGRERLFLRPEKSTSRAWL